VLVPASGSSDRVLSDRVLTMKPGVTCTECPFNQMKAYVRREGNAPVYRSNARLCLLDALENISAQQARRYYRKCGYCVEEPLSAEEVLRNAEAVLAQVDAANEFISNGWIAIAPPPQKQKQSHPPSEVHCLAEPEAWPLPLTARQSPRTCPPSPTPAF